MRVEISICLFLIFEFEIKDAQAFSGQQFHVLEKLVYSKYPYKTVCLHVRPTCSRSCKAQTPHGRLVVDLSHLLYNKLYNRSKGPQQAHNKSTADQQQFFVRFVLFSFTFFSNFICNLLILLLVCMQL